MLVPSHQLFGWTQSNGLETTRMEEALSLLLAKLRKHSASLPPLESGKMSCFPLSSPASETEEALEGEQKGEQQKAPLQRSSQRRT